MWHWLRNLCLRHGNLVNEFVFASIVSVSNLYIIKEPFEKRAYSSVMSLRIS